MRTQVAIPARQATLGLLAALAGDAAPGQLVAVEWDRPRDVGRCIRDADRTGELVDLVGQLTRRTDVRIGLALRRLRGDTEHVDETRCLWVRCATQESIAALDQFTPVPPIMLAEPGAMVGVWPLDRPLAAEVAGMANRRLAKALGADEDAAGAASYVRAPGSPSPGRRPRIKCVRLDELRRVSSYAVLGALGATR